jgi:V/A-type H+-transporting ATPase subunit I
MGGRAVVLDNPHGGVMVLASRKARFALDDELARAGFVAADPPAGLVGLPHELLESLDGERSGVEAGLADLTLERQAFAADCSGRLPNLLAAFAMGAMIEDLGSGLESTARVRRLEGWMPAARIERVAAGLDGLCGGRVAIRVYEPAELVAVRAGREQVPVELRHGRLVRSFERLVVSYGTPLYGTIDPTPFVAFFFILLFALMFGDLGQGALILAAGCLLAAGRPRRLARFQVFAPLLQALGGASMATGLLYGSVFSADSLLVPATRAITGLFGQPMDRLVSLLPIEGFGRLLAFFAFTVGVGAALNSLGLAINMVNRWRLGQRREALFGKTGLAGALFFWYGLGFGLRLVLGGPVGWADIIGFLLPLAAMLFGPEIWDRLAGRHPAGEGGAVGKAVEIVEALSYYLSNTVSFLRVGAFALAHAVLSFSVFTLSDLVGGVALGPLWSILVIVAGNLVILVLEGMIVAIQVTRLQYYEFFSKFFAETGREFRPFRFTYGGVS